MFSSLLVCKFLFVCFPVSNIVEKRVDGFSWNVQDILGEVQKIILKIFGVVSLTNCIQGFFLYVFKEIRICEQHCGKTEKKDVHEIFRKGRAWKTLEYFRDLEVNPLKLGSMFLFSWSCFLVILWENGLKDFHDFLWCVSTTQEVFI